MTVALPGYQASMSDDTTDAPESGTPHEQMGDSIRELFHADQNVGATDDELARQEGARQEAAQENDRLHDQGTSVPVDKR